MALVQKTVNQVAIGDKLQIGYWATGVYFAEVIAKTKRENTNIIELTCRYEDGQIIVFPFSKRTRYYVEPIAN